MHNYTERPQFATFKYLDFPFETYDSKIDKIKEQVISYYKLKPKTFESASRLGHIAVARQIAMYLAREKIHMSYKEIGRHFGKDHTTALYAHKKIRTQIENDSEIRNPVLSIQQQLENVH